MSANVQTFRLPWTTVLTDATSEEFIPVTEWMTTQGWNYGRGWCEIRGVTGSIFVAVAIRVGYIVKVTSGTGGARVGGTCQLALL